METGEKTIIEINGMKLEVDLRYAKRIDTLRVGDRVKCLVKQYGTSWDTCPGVVVGFEPFKNLPSIVVAYLSTGSDLRFKSFNAETTDFEIVPDLDTNGIEVHKDEVVARIQREIDKKQLELQELEGKRAFFLVNFGRYFKEA